MKPNNETYENRLELLKRMQRDEIKRDQEPFSFYCANYGVAPRFIQACKQYGIIIKNGRSWYFKDSTLNINHDLIYKLFDVERKITSKWHSYQKIKKSKHFIDSIKRADLNSVCGTARVINRVEYDGFFPPEFPIVKIKDDELLPGKSSSSVTGNDNKSLILNHSKESYITVAQITMFIKMCNDKISFQGIADACKFNVLDVFILSKALRNVIDTKYLTEYFAEVINTIY